jgi:hypothetical protein
VPNDVKTYRKNFLLFYAPGTPNHGVEHHIHTGATPPFLQNPAASIQKNCKSPRQNSKVRICWHYSQIKITMGFSFAHGTQKRWIMAALWQLPPLKFGDNPRQVSFAKHARPFQQSTWLHNFFKN